MSHITRAPPLTQTIVTAIAEQVSEILSRNFLVTIFADFSREKWFHIRSAASPALPPPRLRNVLSLTAAHSRGMEAR